MKHILKITFIVFISVGTFAVMQSCNKDETTPTDNIIGTWTAATVSVTAMDGAQLLGSYMTEYYLGKGLGEEEALTKGYNFEKAIIEDFKGTLKINPDFTCTADMGELSLLGGSTWSLNPNHTLLTVQAAPSPYDPSRVFYITCDILELTSSKLLLQIHRTIWLSNDQSALNDVIPIEADVNFTKQ